MHVQMVMRGREVVMTSHVFVSVRWCTHYHAQVKKSHTGQQHRLIRCRACTRRSAAVAESLHSRPYSAAYRTACTDSVHHTAVRSAVVPGHSSHCVRWAAMSACPDGCIRATKTHSVNSSPAAARSMAALPIPESNPSQMARQ